VDEEVALAKKIPRAEQARRKRREEDLHPISHVRLIGQIEERKWAEEGSVESNLRLIIYCAQTD